MSMEEHTPSSLDSAGGEKDGMNVSAIAAAAAAAEEEQEGNTSSAANVLPGDSLANGLNVAKGLFSSTWSKARKSITELNESEAMARVREVSKPMVTAVIDGSKVVGEKVHQGVEAAKPGLEEAGRRITQGAKDIAEASKPALKQAGETIKSTTHTIVEETKPMVSKVGAFINEKVGGGGSGGSGGSDPGNPPTTV